jgi:hypothetical protein
MSQAGLVGSRPLNLHTGGPAPSWCLQCGIDGTPEPAIGVDVDGEPACGFHRVRTDSIFLEGKTKVVSAAPSPLPTTKPKEADMAVGQPCACGCGEPCKSNASAYVKGHNPNASNSHHKKIGGATVRKQRVPQDEPKEIIQVLGEGQTPEPEVMVYLSATKVQRLLNLLLA